MAQSRIGGGGKVGAAVKALGIDRGTMPVTCTPGDEAFGGSRIRLVAGLRAASPISQGIGRKMGCARLFEGGRCCVNGCAGAAGETD